MLDILLFSVFVIFILITTTQLIRKDILVGGLYFFVFIYSIFAMLGYCFFPELSILVKAYFGKEYFYKFYFFNFLSFVLFYLVYTFSSRIRIKLAKIEVVKYNSLLLSFVLFLFLIVFYGYNYFYFITNYNSINYFNASDPEFLKSQNILYKIYAISFKSLSPLAIIFYIQFRLKNEFNGISILNKYLLTSLFILSIFTLFFFSNKMGSRTDIVAFLIGAFVFEFNKGLNFKKVLGIASVSIAVLAFLLILEETRLDGNVEERDFSTFESIKIF